MCNIIIMKFILVFFLIDIVYGDYFVTISSDEPVVLGALINFKAEVFDEKHQRATGSFYYVWRDNAIPQHRLTTNYTTQPLSEWSIRYNASEGYAPGPYSVEIIVYQYNWFHYSELTSQRYTFHVTGLLNGHMALTQNNTLRPEVYIESGVSVNHDIVLNAADSKLLQNATQVLTYWFVDCTYMGITDNYTYKHPYQMIPGMEVTEHDVEALVVARYDEIPPITTTPPPTTTDEPTTTPSTTTTNAPITTSSVASIAAKAVTTVPSKQKRSINLPLQSTNMSNINDNTTSTTTETYEALVFKNETEQIAKISNHTLDIRNSSMNEIINTTQINGLNSISDIAQPFVCLNKSVVAPDLNKNYGYFYRKVVVQAPVSNLTVTGNNWLQQGDMLTLNVQCNGSAPYHYCLLMKHGGYNITGNETCDSEITINLCEFKIWHYFRSPKDYTIVVIIRNHVTKLVSPIAITIYKVNKTAPLSVIVVPVAATLVAVTLIVFGVAYYIQSRSRFTVEVADFDFGRAADMEYRTFWERVRNSFQEEFNNIRGIARTTHAGPSTSDSDLKYGTMT